MSAKAFVAVLAVLAVVGLLGFGLIKKNEDALAAGEPAPELTLQDLRGDGSEDLDAFRGQWVLVNFWSSWCPPCKREAPVIEAFQRQHGGADFTVVGIALEDVREDSQAFVRKYALTYPQFRAADSEEAIDSFDLLGRPENVLIDPEGKVALIRRGEIDETFLREEVQPLISGVS
jgi:cytochrome c biogenesis protein CcmG, thiol:disulfide interchange protein DsbE